MRITLSYFRQHIVLRGCYRFFSAISYIFNSGALTLHCHDRSLVRLYYLMIFGNVVGAGFITVISIIIT